METRINDRRRKHSQHKQKAPVVKTPQQRSERYERERRDASERHRRKLKQMAEGEKREPFDERAGDLENEEGLQARS